MKSSNLGKSTSKAEITNVSAFGLWLWYRSKEYFLPYDEFPWFKRAAIAQLTHVQTIRPGVFHWPDLDVDLDLDRIQAPQNYPLISTSAR